MPDVDREEVLGRAFDRRLGMRLWTVTRPHRRVVLGSLLLFPAVAAVELLQPYLIKVAVDEHILRADWVGLGGVAALYVLTLLGLYGLRTAQGYLLQLAGQRVMHDLRGALFAHLQRLEAAFFDRNPVGRLMTRVLNDVEAVSEAFTSGVFAVVADVVTLLGAVAIMLWMNWRLALVTFAVVPLLAAVAGWLRARMRETYREARRRLSRLNGFLQESIQGMSVIQLFGRERHELERFAALTDGYRRALFGSTVYESSLYAAVEALGSAALACLIWYGARELVAGTLTFGALVAFIQYTHRFFLPIRDLGAKYTVMQSAMASSERIFELLDHAPAIVSPPQPLVRRPARPGAASAAFRSVWFAYEGQHWVLRDCSFTVAPGEHLALVGATGAGKSTCARLLNRTYDVTRGQVLVGGADVREWDLEHLRRHVGIIFQDTVLFSGTVEANLRLGADGGVGRAEIERAVEVANARGVVAALPHGLGQELGERGANLSHGQRQLLAIARALVYDPALLVLDEATSSVDPESEALIREAMRRLLAGRTSVTIAHRLSTVQAADRILVLHQGRVREEGSHTDLLRRGGLYAKLYELQSGAG